MDFYIVLGVDRGAAAGDIKRAYKRLARRLHPDINPGDREAEARFRQVLDAYETLMDPDRRRRYDAGQLSSADADDEAETFGFAGFDFSSRVHAERTTTFGELFEEVLSKRAARPAEGAEHGADIHARTLLTFEEAWHGVQRTVTVTRQDVCRVVRRQRLSARRRNALRVVRRHRRRAIGARPHGVCEDLPDLRRGRPVEAGRMRAVPRPGRRAAIGNADGAHSGRRWPTARGCASPRRATPACAAARRAIC